MGLKARGLGGLFGVAVAALAVLSFAAPSADALTRVLQGTFGTAAQPTFTRPTSVAVDKEGKVLVLDGGLNEVQSLKVVAASGQFKLTFGGQTTGDLAFNAPAATVRSALEGLSSIGVKTPSSLLVALSSGVYTITFQNQLGFRDVEQIAVSNGTTPLGGGSPATEATVTTTTQGVVSGIRRFNADGTAANFSGLGTNMIDAQRGPGGKTLAECETAPEPASCDEAPLNGFVFPTGAATPYEVQVAVDTTAGATEGNIYVTQVSRKAIYIFGKDGKYRGQLTAAGATAFASETCGVSVTPTGRLLIGGTGAPASKVVHEFASSGSFPTNADWVRSIPIATTPGGPCNVAAGAGSGPTATLDALFVAKFQANPVVKVDSLAGTSPYSFGSGRLVAVHPTTGQVLVAGASGLVTEYDASGGSSAAETLNFNAASTVQGIGVGANDRVYLTRATSSTLEVYGPPVSPPLVKAFAATGITPTTAVLNGSVDAEELAVTECKFEYGLTASYGQSQSCEGAIPTDTNAHPVSAGLSGLTPNGTTYHYRVVATNAAGTSFSTPDRTFATADQAVTEGASAIGKSAATVHGTVFPSGMTFTECKFEYGLTTSYSATKPCVPAAASIEPDYQPHAVSASLTGLQQNSAYHYRLVAKNSLGAVVIGKDMTLTTIGAPTVTHTWSLPVGITTATLRANLNPNKQNTVYRFEWGTTTAYGNQAPDHEPNLAAGEEAVPVGIGLSDLQPSTAYHYRIVATNASGTTFGPDHRFTTLNSSGAPDLPGDRAYELVSPPNKRPQGGTRYQFANTFQAALDGQSVTFPLLGGLADTDSGGDTTYLAKRSPTGWSSTKVSPPSILPAPSTGSLNNASPGLIAHYAPDLSCSIVNSFNPLTEDTPAATQELGLYNLYVRHEDGSYTLITNTVPENLSLAPEADGVGAVAGATPDCSRVYFRSPYKYLPDASGLYEWDEGVLRDAGRLPNGSRALNAAAGSEGSPSAFSSGNSRVNSVSSDGRRSFFSAQSNEPATNGKRAVFVREVGSPTIEASRRQGGIRDSLGSIYEVASPDGSHVFFTSTYGLTPNSSTGPAEDCSGAFMIGASACDLYDYDVETGDLTNISATTAPANTNGATVSGVLAVSRDGSSVYFAARGQLVAGKGKTYAQNIAEELTNVYLARAGGLQYVATVSLQDMNPTEPTNILVRGANTGLQSAAVGWTSEATPDGDHLVFQSIANVTGYDSGGVMEAYLYSVDTGSTICLSCRPDGQPSVGNPTEEGKVRPEAITLPLSVSILYNQQAHLRKITDDGSQIFFKMPDVLAPGAVSGNNNIYEWRDGEVYLLATGSVGSLGLLAPDSTLFYSTTGSGDDVFIRTTNQLTPHDTDFVQDIYDIRVGGGFAPPQPPPVPCDPAADECQGAPGSPPSVPSAPSSDFNGSGNPAPEKAQPPKCGKGKVLKHGKCVKKQGKKKKQKGKANSKTRAAGKNLGGVK